MLGAMTIRTTLKTMMAAAALMLSAVTAAGCSGGASCQSICERAQSLGCGSATCVSSCEETRQNASRAGCSSEWQAFANCGEENVCTDVTVACRDELVDGRACVVAFCVRNPSDPLCRD
jgi:hypothetical protein